jgi:hypothetical protein
MGGEQAAAVLAQVKRDGMEKRGESVSYYCYDID